MSFQTFLVVSVFLGGVFSLLHVLIPPARTEFSLPNKTVKFDLYCSKDSFEIAYAEPTRCESPDKLITVDVINAEKCGYMCTPPALDMSYFLKKEKEGIFIHISDYKCEVTMSDKQKCYVDDGNLNLTELANVDKFELQNVALDFPKVKNTGKLLTFQLKPNTYAMKPQDSNIFDCKTGKRKPEVNITKMYVKDTKENFHSPSGSPKVTQCEFHCEGTMPVNFTCGNTSWIIDHNILTTFWLLIVAKGMGSLLLGLTYTLFETGVMAILKEHDYDYGIQRIYGSIGGMIFAPVTGYLIDYFGNNSLYTDY